MTRVAAVIALYSLFLSSVFCMQQEPSPDEETLEQVLIRETEQLCGALEPGRFRVNTLKPHEISWNVAKAYALGTFLGRGTFGDVYTAPFPVDHLPDEFSPEEIKRLHTVAIKQVFLSRMDNTNEIRVMKAMSLDKKGPLFLGCQLNQGKNAVYLVLEKLDYNMDSEPVRNYMKLLPNLSRWKLYTQFLFRLLDFWEFEYIHNDIKFDNAMISQDGTRIELIDFGTAQPMSTPLLNRGTPFLLSPGKFREDDDPPLAALRDDLYSLVLEIAGFETGDIEKLYADQPSEEKTWKCRNGVSLECVLSLRKRAIAVFEKFFPMQPLPGQPATVENMNLIRLFDEVLEYDSFKRSVADVRKVVARFDAELDKKIRSQGIDKILAYAPKIKPPTPLVHKQVQNDMVSSDVVVKPGHQGPLNGMASSEVFVGGNLNESITIEKPDFLNADQPDSNGMSESIVIEREAPWTTSQAFSTKNPDNEMDISFSII